MDYQGQLKAPKKRKFLDDAQRQSIRDHHYANPTLNQKDLAQWFETTRGSHPLNQGDISKILSSKYDYLDEFDKRIHRDILKRQKSAAGQYPELEAALFEWQQRVQQLGAIITGEILKARAALLWQELPQYRDIEEPKWSNGWLDGFKKRFHIRQFVLHGEAASAAINDAAAITQMQLVRDLAAKYEPRDIFNMDETGLFWKMTPDRTLATKAGSGGKKSKDRVTVALTCNADGSEKLEPWIIGKSTNPRCFKHVNRSHLRVIYRNNKSKWMTGPICEEYLKWLNNIMRARDRKVLLLMDNFSAHYSGAQLCGGETGLSNIRVEWLPPNTTSHWQPLDQGIIASYKLQYRKQWIAYMLRQYEAGRDPNKTVNLLKAVQWTRIAWNQGVSADTIKRCFWKSTVIKKPIDAQDITDTSYQADQVELQAQIEALPIALADILPLNEFLNPDEEIIEDYEREDIFEAVVERYSGYADGAEPANEAEDGIFEEPLVLTKDAVTALDAVKQWCTLYSAS